MTNPTPPSHFIPKSPAYFKWQSKHGPHLPNRPITPLETTMASFFKACPITNLDCKSRQEIIKAWNAWEGWVKTKQPLSHNNLLEQGIVLRLTWGFVRHLAK